MKRRGFTAVLISLFLLSSFVVFAQNKKESQKPPKQDERAKSREQELANKALKKWLEEDVAQCGYCQPGMIMATAALVDRNPKPTALEVEQALNDMICRCGTYPRIRKAIRRALGETR